MSRMASAQLSQLTLPALREYRCQLRAEEERVSYWRRLVQARLDTARAGRGGAALTRQQIAAALGDGPASQRRLARLAVEVSRPLPEVPQLAGLWATPVPNRAGPALEALIDELADAERQLSSYRSVLHQLIDEATAELVVRYRRDPTACFDLLPSAGYPEPAIA